MKSHSASSNHFETMQGISLGRSLTRHTSIPLFRRIIFLLTFLLTSKAKIVAKLRGYQHICVILLILHAETQRIVEVEAGPLVQGGDDILRTPSTPAEFEALADRIIQSSLETRLKVFDILGIHFPLNGKEMFAIILSLALIAVGIYFICKAPWKKDVVEPLSDRGDGEVGSCFTHAERNPKSNQSHRFNTPVGETLYTSVNVPVHPNATKCKLQSSHNVNSFSKKSAEIINHQCEKDQGFDTTIAFHTHLYGNLDLIIQHHPWGILIVIHPGSSHVKTTRHDSNNLIFNGLRTISLKFDDPQSAVPLFCFLSSWNIPDFSLFAIDNGFIDLQSQDCLIRLLNKPTLTGLSLNNTILCDNCKLLEQIDPSGFRVVRMLLKNNKDEEIAEIVRRFLACATQLEELRWNIPINESLLDRVLHNAAQLKILEATVNVEHKRGQFFLSFEKTLDSSLEELDLLINVTNGDTGKGNVAVTLEGFHSVGPKLRKIKICTNEGNSLRMTTQGIMTDEWDMDMIERVPQKGQICRQLVKRSD